MASRIVTIGNTKGGVGKSTIALQMAIYAGGKRAKTLLIDADSQGTSFTAYAVRCQFYQDSNQTDPAAFQCFQFQPQQFLPSLKAQESLYDIIIIDAGGRDTATFRLALGRSDILIAPFPPGSFEYWAKTQLETVLAEITQIQPNLQSFSILNRAMPTARSENEDMIRMLKENQEYLTYLDAPIMNRKAHQDAVGQGRAVWEAPKNKRNSYAISELKYLCDQVLSL